MTARIWLLPDTAFIQKQSGAVVSLPMLLVLCFNSVRSFAGRTLYRDVSAPQPCHAPAAQISPSCCAATHQNSLVPAFKLNQTERDGV